MQCKCLKRKEEQRLVSKFSIAGGYEDSRIPIFSFEFFVDVISFADAAPEQKIKIHLATISNLANNLICLISVYFTKESVVTCHFTHSSLRCCIFTRAIVRRIPKTKIYSYEKNWNTHDLRVIVCVCVCVLHFNARIHWKITTSIWSFVSVSSIIVFSSLFLFVSL